MQVLLEQKGRTLIARIQGELDHHSAASIRSEIDSRLSSVNVSLLIFDFSDVTFMDSSGIGVIIGRFKLLKESGGFVAIAGVSAQIDKVLNLSGIKKIIPLYHSVKEAEKNLGGGQK